MNETDRMLEDMLKAVEKSAKVTKNEIKEKFGDEIGSLLADLKNQTNILSDKFIFIDCSNEKNLDSFYICKHPVTQKEFEDVMGINPSRFQLNNAKLKDEEIEQLKKEDNTENCPVEMVSFYDAIYYCNKRSILEGLEPVYSVDGKTDWGYVPCKWKRGSRGKINPDANGYRLPTLNEWEYAARGGEKFDYSGSDNIDEVAWYLENSNRVVHPVMQKKPNGYGLYDMSGNVDEWCDHSESTCENSYGGGNCYSSDEKCKWWKSFASTDSSNRFGSLGFRVVRSSIQ